MKQTGIKSLNDVCELIIDCEHKTAPIQKTGYPSIRTPNIGRGRLILENVNRVSEKTYKEWTKRAIPQTEDLILAREAPVGNVAIIPKNLKVCLGQRTVLIRADKKKVNPHYLVYLLLGDEIQGKIKSISNGATVHHFNMKDIRNLELPELPSLKSQGKIASILSNYDDLIENNNRRIEILEQMAKLVYEEWFVLFRFPGHENVKMVPSDLGEIPEGWKVCSIKEITTLIKRGVAPKYEESSNSIVINQKCIRNFRLNLEESRRHISKVPHEKYLAKGDILINSTGVGTLGRVAQVLEDLPNCTIDTHVTIVRPEKDLDFNFFGLQIFRLQSYFESQGRGATGQAELGRDTIEETKFIVAPKEIQDSFSSLVDSLRNLAIKLDKKKSKSPQDPRPASSKAHFRGN